MKFKQVFHCSPITRLDLIRPHIGLHGKRWIYATWDIAMSIPFINTLGLDFTCTIDRRAVDNIPFVCERFEGAFELRYKNSSGSVYVLPGDSFQTGMTHWLEELVSEQTVAPVDEIPVDNGSAMLERLADKGAMAIYSFPDRPDDIPEDDEDLVLKTVLYTRLFGENTLDELEKWQPQLVVRALQALRKIDGR